jgi:hypothetical protein
MYVTHCSKREANEGQTTVGDREVDGQNLEN